MEQKYATAAVEHVVSREQIRIHRGLADDHVEYYVRRCPQKSQKRPRHPGPSACDAAGGTSGNSTVSGQTRKPAPLASPRLRPWRCARCPLSTARPIPTRARALPPRGQASPTPKSLKAYYFSAQREPHPKACQPRCYMSNEDRSNSPEKDANNMAANPRRTAPPAAYGGSSAYLAAVVKDRDAVAVLRGGGKHRVSSEGVSVREVHKLLRRGRHHRY